jgi:hypothetical protein
MALNKDTLLNSVLAASGGKQVIKYNINGDPCVFTRIPRFNLEDIHADLGTGPHPAFVVNGVVKNELFVATYPAVIEKGCAVSIPGQSPKADINFDAAKAACEANGPGYHLLTAWERAAIALWCLKNNFQPRGNTAGGKSHEASWEAGTPAPDNALKTLGGSGPASWRHDGTLGGISDLTGNVSEWVDGLKSIDGRLYFPPDNDFAMPEAQWPASPLYLDATNAEPGDRDGAAATGNIVVSDRVTKYSETPAPAGGTDPGDFDQAYNAAWAQTAVSSYFDALPLEVRQAAARLMIAPKLSAAGDPLFSAVKGAFYSRNYGERLPFWGGFWGYGAIAGLASLNLHYRRSVVNGGIGLRTAFIL